MKIICFLHFNPPPPRETRETPLCVFFTFKLRIPLVMIIPPELWDGKHQLSSSFLETKLIYESVCPSVTHIFIHLTLVMMGGALCAPPPHHSLFSFLHKISPPDQTLTPTCKFLILGIFYQAKKNLKIWYIKSFIT